MSLRRDQWYPIFQEQGMSQAVVDRMSNEEFVEKIDFLLECGFEYPSLPDPEEEQMQQILIESIREAQRIPPSRNEIPQNPAQKVPEKPKLNEMPKKTSQHTRQTNPTQYDAQKYQNIIKSDDLYRNRNDDRNDHKRPHVSGNPSDKRNEHRNEYKSEHRNDQKNSQKIESRTEHRNEHRNEYKSEHRNDQKNSQKIESRTEHRSTTKDSKSDEKRSNAQVSNPFQSGNNNTIIRPIKNLNMPPNYNNAKRYDYKDKKDDSGDDDDDAEFVRKYGQHKSNDRKRDPTQKNEKNIFDFSDSSSDSVNFVEPRPTSNIRSKRNIYINEEPKNVALPPLPKTQQGHIKQQHHASKPITSKVKPALQPSSNPFQPAPQTKTSSAKQQILSFSNQMLKEEKEAPKYSSTGSNQADKMKTTSDTNTKKYRMNGVVVKTVPNLQSESAPKKTAVPQITTTKSVKSSTDKTSAAASILSPTVVPSTLFKQPATTITAKKLTVEPNQPTTKPPSQVSAPKSSQLNITPSNSSTKSKSTLSSDIKSESASKPEQAVSSTPATSTITKKTLKTTSTVKQTTTTIEPYSTVQNPGSNINSNVKQVTDAVNDTSTKQKANIPPTIKQTIQDKPQLPPKQPSIQSKSQQVQKPLENKALASEPLEKPATIEEEQEKRRAELRAKLGHPTIEERMNDPRFKSPFVMPPPFVVTEEAKNIIDWNYKPPENSDTKTSAPKSIETKKPSIEIDWNYIPPSKEEIRRQKEEEKEKAMNKVKIDWSYQIPQENNSSSKNEKNEDNKKKIQHNNSTMNNEKKNDQKTIIDWSYKANDKNNFITSERRKKNKEEEEMETKKRIMQQREILHRGKEEDERPIEAKPIEERINKSDILEKNKLNMEYERDTIIALCGALQPEPTNGIRIAVQLPSGERKMRKFDKNTLGEDVFFWIANNDELFNEDGKPKRYYIQNADRKFDVNLTLEEQGIIRATLLNIIYF